MGGAGDRVAEASSLLFDFARERGHLYQCEDCNEEYLPSPFVFLAAPPSDYSFSVRVLCQTLRESFSAIFGEDEGFMADYGYDPNSGETSALRLNDFIMSEAFHAGILDLYENGLVDAFREFAPQNPIGDPRDNPGTSPLNKKNLEERSAGRPGRKQDRSRRRAAGHGGPGGKILRALCHLQEEANSAAPQERKR